MLKQRIITAVVLLGVLALVITAASPWPFLVFLAVTCACAGFEWLRLTLGKHSVWALVGAFAMFVASVWQAHQWIIGQFAPRIVLQSAICLAVFLWLVLLLPALWRAQVTMPVYRLANSFAAIVTLLATWGALAYWYLQRGAIFVLSLLIVVWVADIAAYFAGRAFGRRKLAPSISPGKTLEGAFAGVIGVVVWLTLSTQWPESFAANLLSHSSWFGLLITGVLLAVFSIAGDLYESLLKRRAGVKDSSQLLPGHGGVYDRIDAVVAVVPLGFLLIEWRSW